MAGFVLVFACVCMCVAVRAAPPATPRLYQQAQLQQINPLDYYLDHSELHNYYNEQQQQQKQAASQNPSSRLETLEPDSEVELIPGAQQPQQPPQQPPQNIPGLIPGQRVFIIHMPIPGLRPGTIGGYQPVYIVAAGPQGNPAGFPGNGYQNAVLLNPSNQVVTPLGYPGGVVQGHHPGLMQGNPLIFGHPQQINRPFDLIYQDPAAAYQRVVPAGQQGPDNQSPVRLAQLVNLQTQPASSQASEAASAEPKQQNQAPTESKEARNLRLTSAHAQARPKSN